MNPMIEERDVTLCPECTAEIDPEDAAERPIYECSRCGSSVIPEPGERARCSTCNIFCGKVADASCPECEQEVDLTDLTEVHRWFTADGEAHESLADAEAWIAAEPEREAAKVVAAARREAEIEEWRLESIARKQRLTNAVATAKAHGVPMEWANDSWNGWKDSSAVYLHGGDLLALVGLSKAEFDATPHGLDLLAEKAVEFGFNVHEIADDRLRVAYLYSLFTEHGYGNSQTSWDTLEFCAYVERRWPS